MIHWEIRKGAYVKGEHDLWSAVLIDPSDRNTPIVEELFQDYRSASSYIRQVQSADVRVFLGSSTVTGCA